MLRKLFALPVLGLAAIALTSSSAKAQEYGFDAGNWELTLSGSGTNDRDFNSTSFGVDGSIGYFFTDNLEVALRQNITYTDIGATKGSAWNGSTDVALDFHFDLGRWQPFIGANIGYAYGDSTNDTFEAAPARTWSAPRIWSSACRAAGWSSTRRSRRPTSWVRSAASARCSVRGGSCRTRSSAP